MEIYDMHYLRLELHVSFVSFRFASTLLHLHECVCVCVLPVMHTKTAAYCIVHGVCIQRHDKTQTTVRKSYTRRTIDTLRYTYGVLSMLQSQSRN